MGSNLYATPPPKGSLEAQRVASCLLIERSHRRAGQSDIGPLTREYCFRATAGKKGRKKRQKKKKKEQPTPEIRTRWSIPCPVPCASMHILILIPRPKFRNLGSVARFSTLSPRMWQVARRYVGRRIDAVQRTCARFQGTLARNKRPFPGGTTVIKARRMEGNRISR